MIDLVHFLRKKKKKLEFYSVEDWWTPLFWDLFTGFEVQKQKSQQCSVCMSLPKAVKGLICSCPIEHYSRLLETFSVKR